MTRLKSNPALLVIDMQNGYCKEGGIFHKLDYAYWRLGAISGTIKSLVDVCRAHNIPIFWIQTAFNENDSDRPKGMEGFGHGTWDVEFVEELRSEVDPKRVVCKARDSAFQETNLRESLEKLGINQIIAIGVSTDHCVESTVKEANAQGFHTLTVSDATAALTIQDQQDSLACLQDYGGTILAKELEEEIKDWKPNQPTQPAQPS